MKIRCSKMLFKNMLLLMFIGIIASSIKAITKTSNAKQITTADVDNNNNQKLSSNVIDNGVGAIAIAGVAGVDDDNDDYDDGSVKHLKQVATTTENVINLILITTPKTTKFLDFGTSTTKYNETMLMAKQKLIMTTGKIPISATKPEHFNKNSLQQQQHQQEALPKAATTLTIQQRHYKDDNDDNDEQYILDNKHPPCDYIEHEIDNGHSGSDSGCSMSIKSTAGDDDGNLFKSPQIAVTAKGYKPLVSTSNSVNSIENNGNGSVSNAFTSSPTMMTTTTTVFNVARNGFRDKINISNQQNEFSNVDDDDSTTVKRIKPYDDIVVQRSQQQARFHRNIRAITSNRSSMDDDDDHDDSDSDAMSSFFERVELLESNLSPDEQHELLLHRRKRYLVFPEGSSFQLVFDLIIGIVDYTSYAILGITCSVAWELPSKPPSEIIENFRDKLNDGSFGLQRRNDTIENNELQYVDTKTKQKDTNTIQQKATSATVTATAANEGTAASIKFTNFQNDENAWKPQTVFNYYNKLNMQTAAEAEAEAAAATPTVTSYYRNGGSSKSNFNYYKSATDITSGIDVAPTAEGDNFAKTQRKTLNEKEVPPSLQSSRWYSYNQPNRDYASTMFYNNKKKNTMYYSKNNNNNNNRNKNVWNFSDKRKYFTPSTDWYQYRQEQMHAGSSGNSKNADRFVDNVGGSSSRDNDDYMPDGFESYQHTQQTNYAGEWQQKDNWWQRNKQRLQTKLHDKQQATWAKYAPTNDEESSWQDYAPKKPMTDYAPPFENKNGYQRTGRQRKILTSPPKHRIYPVFGRKKRSILNKENSITKLELEMERIHLREQLQSRQKLYGKIEQVFKTRGHNGTECVLRALCETGQRQYEHERHHPRYNRQPHSSTIGQHREPQSFITELLRAIFALPRENIVAKRSSRSSYNSVDFKNAGNNISTIDLELQQKHQEQQQHEFESHISWHYRAAHIYDGNCAVRFAGCKLSIWDDMALDNGFGHSVADTFARTFKM